MKLVLFQLPNFTRQLVRCDLSLCSLQSYIPSQNLGSWNNRKWDLICFLHSNNWSLVTCLCVHNIYAMGRLVSFRSFYRKFYIYIRISLPFWLIKKGNSASNISCKFQLHSMQIFFSMATYNFLEWQPPPSLYTHHLWWLTLPHLKGESLFSPVKMTANDDV